LFTIQTLNVGPRPNVSLIKIRSSGPTAGVQIADLSWTPTSIELS